ncbi:glutaredoxin domain-containing cysteine-rich protein 2 [Sardina pilchardus]|uniref:glutaredoxin domain-containing cysteine-rich protein 2 n=1 Tax=Sardina pilchardus TaxID=27697 RepID=UPI002E14DD20
MMEGQLAGGLDLKYLKPVSRELSSHSTPLSHRCAGHSAAYATGRLSLSEQRKKNRARGGKKNPADMEESQRKFGPRYAEAKPPRKVRFKLNSSYSGRVLKHVYEDGQELESPEEKYPHSFMHTKIPRHLDAGQLCSFTDLPEQPAGLYAQRINVYRGVTGFRPPTFGDLPEGDPNAPVLDFGKIIIYTSNLRIVPAPQRRREREREREKERESEARGCGHGNKEMTSPKHKQDAGGCLQCGGSGCAPCSLCHGSKLSMLAIRFNESIRDLRCQACYPEGLEPCQSCAQ